MAAKQLLRNPSGFSQLVIKFPLYTYQLTPLMSIINSVLNQHGHEYLLVFPRQSGKNEAIAQLLVYLMNLLQRRGGNIVYGATGDGIGRGISRLEERLDNPWNIRQWRKSTKPTRRRLGNATVVFLSTHPAAAVRGETAHWLLVIDEMQDQAAAHLEAVFEPMRAANNATAVYIGPVKTTHDALWRKRDELLQLEAADGLTRVYIVPAETVTAENTNYATFLDAKVAKFGRHHPIVASEYYNEPIQASGGLFDKRRQQLMIGDHPPAQEPDPNLVYVATIDVGGQDESATDPIKQLDNPGRDYTIAHIFAIDLADNQPTYHAVDIFVDHGSRHFQDIAGRASMAHRLHTWLDHWKVAHTICDATGVGEGLTDWLTAKSPGRVTGYTFNRRSKAALGTAFLATIETGRFHYFRDDQQPLSDTWWFLAQADACTYHVPDEGQFETDLKWSVPPSASIDTPTGREPIHDDRLISAALVAAFDDLYRTGNLLIGSARSEVIPAYDPLDHLTW